MLVSQTDLVEEPIRTTSCPVDADAELFQGCDVIDLQVKCVFLASFKPTTSPHDVCLKRVLLNGLQLNDQNDN